MDTPEKKTMDNDAKQTFSQDPGNGTAMAEFRNSSAAKDRLNALKIQAKAVLMQLKKVQDRKMLLREQLLEASVSEASILTHLEEKHRLIVSEDHCLEAKHILYSVGRFLFDIKHSVPSAASSSSSARGFGLLGVQYDAAD